MASLFYPHRHHRSHYHLTPYRRSGPTSWTTPNIWSDPFQQPFVSLFNDTFAELDRLSNDLNNQLNNSVGTSENWQKMLTIAPKFDVKETDDAYILDGELPGVERKDISLEFADDNTLVLKTRTETFREEGAPPAAKQGEHQAGGSAEQAQVTGANAEASTDKTVTKTSNERAVTKSSDNKPTYHLTERSVGTYQRAFNLPGQLKHDAVKASLKNGVLTVTVPKMEPQPEPPKNRTVQVEEVNDEDTAMKQ